MRDSIQCARLLAFVTGLVNQELLLQNEYLVAENRILRAHLPTRLRLSDPERSTLAEIGKRLGRKVLKEVARAAKPNTILGWYQRLIAHKFDGSRHRAYPGRPRVEPAVEALVVRFARENTSWGYDRIVGALANLGHHLSDQTVGNILRRHDITPAPTRSRSTSWKEFIRSHMDVLAGSDFFTAEVLTWSGLVTYFFYEKVVKVKADVAAILIIVFLPGRNRPRSETSAETGRGMAQGGRKPLLRGEPQQGPCQRGWLARNVSRRGGNFPRPGFPLGGNGKGGSDSTLPQAVRCCADCMHTAAFLCAVLPIFSPDNGHKHICALDFVPLSISFPDFPEVSPPHPLRAVLLSAL